MTEKSNAPLIELRSDLSSICAALDAEGFAGVAGHVAKAFKKYEDAIGQPGDVTQVNWATVAARLEAQAGVMHKENASLLPAARNTPFGVMTGTATIVLSAIASAIDVGMGRPKRETVQEVLATLRAERARTILERAQQPRG